MYVFIYIYYIIPRFRLDSEVDLQQMADAVSSEMNLLNLPIAIDDPRRFTALDVLGLSSVGLSTKAPPDPSSHTTRSDFLIMSKGQ